MLSIGHSLIRRSSPLKMVKKLSTQVHYEAHSSESYESAYFYSHGAYTEHLRRIVVKKLGLEAETKRRLLDIGGGTGNFTESIVEKSPEVEAVVVDPFLEMEQDTKQVKFAKAPAEAFARPSGEWWRKDYHQVLMKEVVHHLNNRAPIFRGILEDLPDKPSADPNILIITRPQVDIDYPLWDEAREVWAENQPSYDDIESELKEAGFSQVTYCIEPYPCEIDMDRWLDMVRGRFWSTFSNFSDEELDEACERMLRDEKERIDSDGIIHFEDRLLFISAYK